MASHTPIEGTNRFTEHLWDRTKALRVAIDELEFLRRLGDGTLPLDVFRFYVEQDSLYLTGYAKALAILASRSPDPTTAAFWATSSATAAVVESALHDELLSGGVLPAAEREPQHSSACLGYVSYLIAAGGDTRTTAGGGGGRTGGVVVNSVGGGDRPG
ncbi:TenA family transcriptional regulator, partial [Rhodococcus sp. NPDC058514]|uniref:TenA family transcriptional regulator n=1 Tax=Rhodococcus sp. NPDC058514 TaxID=3346532 RepID=UPI003653FDC9